MKVRRFIPQKDYETIKGWFERRGVKAPPLILLPETAVIAHVDEIEVAYAGLYEDRWGKISMVEWEVTNPDVHSAMLTLRALNCLFQFFEGYCRDMGIKFVLSWTAEGRGDGRLLRQRDWVNWPGPRHELMCFETTKPKAATELA